MTLRHIQDVLWLILQTSRVTIGLPGGSVVKNPPANAGDMGLIPGWGRSPGEGMGTHSCILAWEIHWAEEPGGLHP